MNPKLNKLSYLLLLCQLGFSLQTTIREKPSHQRVARKKILNHILITIYYCIFVQVSFRYATHSQRKDEGQAGGIKMSSIIEVCT
jgi:hypothetical protein